jgi:hypothetical protein
VGLSKYQWNIKYYGFENDWEPEEALRWAFGEYLYKDGGHFETLDEVVGRRVHASTAGRSGGWLVIHDELTDEEFAAVDRHVKACLAGLTDFLKSERQFLVEQKMAAEEEEKARRKALKSDARVNEVVDCLREISGPGNDFVLFIKGIRIDSTWSSSSIIEPKES